jgi:hypothetical protein
MIGESVKTFRTVLTVSRERLERGRRLYAHMARAWVMSKPDAASRDWAVWWLSIKLFGCGLWKYGSPRDIRFSLISRWWKADCPGVARRKTWWPWVQEKFGRIQTEMPADLKAAWEARKNVLREEKQKAG